MEPAHTVYFLTSLAEEGGHTELLALVVGIGAAHAHKVVPADTHAGGELVHIFVEETLVKVVVACRNGRVNGVERRGANEFESLVE